MDEDRMMLDEDALVAGVDLCGRSGARAVEIGWDEDDRPVGEPNWWAKAQYRGAVIATDRLYGYPHEAAEALARRILDGAACAHCGGPVVLAGVTTEEERALVEASSLGTDRAKQIREMAPPHQVERILARVAKADGVCRWTRKGRRWERGCEETDASASHTPPGSTDSEVREGGD